jgi:phosphatidylcholine synthase
VSRTGAEPSSGELGSRAQRACAFAVHIFTASGAACALMALLAAVAREWTAMFAWLGAALAIDGIDGTIARHLRVALLLPRWSGDTLDLVVDFLTYVLEPAYAIVASDLLPPQAALAAGIAIVVSSALYFADRNMKMADNSFRGFPALWNVAAFYLFIVRPSPWVAAGAIAALTILTFVPLPFVHPFRVRPLRAVSVALLILWALLATLALAHDLAPSLWVTATLCVIAAYFLLAGLVRRLV